jgi:hypothetical protein
VLRATTLVLLLSWTTSIALGCTGATAALDQPEEQQKLLTRLDVAKAGGDPVQFFRNDERRATETQIRARVKNIDYSGPEVVIELDNGMRVPLNSIDRHSFESFPIEAQQISGFTPELKATMSVHELMVLSHLQTVRWAPKPITFFPPHARHTLETAIKGRIETFKVENGRVFITLIGDPNSYDISTHSFENAP